MNTNALALMSRKLDQQVGMRFEPLGFGARAFLFLAYLLIAAIIKQPFVFISGLNIGKSKSLKCATNFRLYSQFRRLAKVYSGYK
jgi:hypothetical protein